MLEQLIVSDLRFTVQRSPRRTTVSLTVERDNTLVLTAPSDCPLTVIEQVAQSKQFWVYTKLAQKALLAPASPRREYVTGEGFYYLGRSYRLRLSEPPLPTTSALRLYGGRFLLRRDERTNGAAHFVAWYTTHARLWLARRIALFADRIGVEPGPMTIRDLGFRWGSCGKAGKLNFHWRTILVPPRLSDYIVAHELVHLCEPHHGPSFWQRLERTMPDYVLRKQWLAEHGGRFQ